MAIIGIDGSLFQGGSTGRLVHSLLDHSPLVKSLKRRGTALPLTGLALFLPACAWSDAGEQSSPAPPVNSQAPAASEKPKYLIFWSTPEKAGEFRTAGVSTKLPLAGSHLTFGEATAIENPVHVFRSARLFASMAQK
jgi:hypothetical protein